MKKIEVDYKNKNQKQRIYLKSSSRYSSRSLQKKGSFVKAQETQNLTLGEQFSDLGVKVSRLLGVGDKVKIPNLVASIRQLSVMTNAGISIHDSIKEVAASTEDRVLKGIFSTMNDDLNAGLSLTESTNKFRNQLGDLTISMISLGENTGNMAESLQKLSAMLQEVWDNQQKFKKAMRYPIVILVCLAIAFTILMLFVVPQFREIFEELGANLPLPTKILLNIEYVMSHYGLYVLGALILGIYLLVRAYKNSDSFKMGFDKGILKVYLFGKIVYYSTMARFNLIFTELVKAGVPIADALDTAIMMVGNTEIKFKLSTVKASVEQGVSITDALKNTGLYESMLIQMVSAGEQSGSLDKMLGNVSDYFKMRFDEIIDNISSYIEPILLLFMAGMVLLLALGIFMPMWDLGSAVKN
ncbi:MAG: type II secretion system F family protein [Campylobacter sp.]|nr:type II secretion system F family protein [Campylobacter sp.]